MCTINKYIHINLINKFIKVIILFYMKHIGYDELYIEYYI